MGARARRSTGWPRRRGRSASRSSPATSRSTTRRTAARSTRRPSSARSGSSRTSARVPKGWNEGDSLLLAQALARRRSRAPSTRRASARRAGARAARPRGRGAARRRSSGGRRRDCSLVHDASEGGLAVCLAEAAIFSGCGAELSLGDDTIELFGEVGGRAVLACAPERRDELSASPRARRPARASASPGAIRCSAWRSASSGPGKRHDDQRGREADAFRFRSDRKPR